MPPASRRIFLYWLLLLVPTLVVGGGAIQLLRREQARLATQGAYAREAQEAAVSARARLIVENVELLVGDVETGLLDTLAEEPAANLGEFMPQWEAANPLVRTAFICTPDGRLLRPDGNGEDGRGFARRFEQAFGGAPPWASTLSKHEGVTGAPERLEKDTEASVRKEVAMNVAQVQSARRDVQALTKSRNYAGSMNTPGSASGLLADKAVSGSSSADTRLAESVRAENRRAELERKVAAAEAGRTSEFASRERQAAKNAADATPYANADPGERRGWVARRIDGRLHLIGWVQPASAAEVRGVEAEMTALVSRLAGALPAELSGDEGYALLDEQGRVLHQIGGVARSHGPLVRVPIAASLLPGWHVVGYLPVSAGDSAAGPGFIWISGLLVGIFVIAILAGGSLLLRQARRSEAEAAQKTSFVANVSHEFKTPLTTIRLYAELLEQGRVRDTAQGGDYLRTIGRETQRLARLINNVLDFSRLEQGRKKFARDPIDLCAELSRFLMTHAPRVAEAGLTLESKLPPGPLTVTADRDALEQILLNLVDNACKYAPDSGALSVTAVARTSGGAEVRIGDRGPGVPVEQRERIFDKFHRVDDSLSAEKTGAGLGLSIARQLARGMGGELLYAPRSGGGAEFILQLP